MFKLASIGVGLGCGEILSIPWKGGELIPYRRFFIIFKDEFLKRKKAEKEESVDRFWEDYVPGGVV